MVEFMIDCNKKKKSSGGWGNGGVGVVGIQCTTKNIIALMKELND